MQTDDQNIKICRHFQAIMNYIILQEVINNWQKKIE